MTGVGSSWGWRFDFLSAIFLLCNSDLGIVLVVVWGWTATWLFVAQAYCAAVLRLELIAALCRVVGH